jgi:hypothetical protein
MKLELEHGAIIAVTPSMLTSMQSPDMLFRAPSAKVHIIVLLSPSVQSARNTFVAFTMRHLASCAVLMTPLPSTDHLIFEHFLL